MSLVHAYDVAGPLGENRITQLPPHMNLQQEDFQKTFGDPKQRIRGMGKPFPLLTGDTATSSCKGLKVRRAKDCGHFYNVPHVSSINFA